MSDVVSQTANAQNRLVRLEQNDGLSTCIYDMGDAKVLRNPVNDQAVI
jgi:hypothetical protein